MTTEDSEHVEAGNQTLPTYIHTLPEPPPPVADSTKQNEESPIPTEILTNGHTTEKHDKPEPNCPEPAEVPKLPVSPDVAEQEKTIEEFKNFLGSFSLPWFACFRSNGEN